MQVGNEQRIVQSLRTLADLIRFVRQRLVHGCFDLARQDPVNIGKADEDDCPEHNHGALHALSSA